jgi:hypothetical protein
MKCECLKITTGRKCQQAALEGYDDVCRMHQIHLDKNGFKTVDQWNNHVMHQRSKNNLTSPNASPVKRKSNKKSRKSQKKSPKKTPTPVKAKSPSKSKSRKSPTKKSRKSGSKSPKRSSPSKVIMSPKLIKKIDSAIKSLSPRK